MKTSIKILSIAVLAIAAISYGAYDKMHGIAHPRELINAISNNGALSVVKDSSYTNIYPAELNMKLRIDGQEGFEAYRFSSSGMAADYCETEDNCIHVGYWAITSANLNAEQKAVWAKLMANPHFRQ